MVGCGRREFKEAFEKRGGTYFFATLLMDQAERAMRGCQFRGGLNNAFEFAFGGAGPWLHVAAWAGQAMAQIGRRSSGVS